MGAHFPGNMGTWVPIFPGVWGPLRENGDPHLTDINKVVRIQARRLGGFGGFGRTAHTQARVRGEMCGRGSIACGNASAYRRLRRYGSSGAEREETGSCYLSEPRAVLTSSQQPTMPWCCWFRVCERHFHGFKFCGDGCVSDTAI